MQERIFLHLCFQWYAKIVYSISPKKTSGWRKHAMEYEFQFHEYWLLFFYSYYRGSHYYRKFYTHLGLTRNSFRDHQCHKECQDLKLVQNLFLLQFDYLIHLVQPVLIGLISPLDIGLVFSESHFEPHVCFELLSPFTEIAVVT